MLFYRYFSRTMLTALFALVMLAGRAQAETDLAAEGVSFVQVSGTWTVVGVIDQSASPDQGPYDFSWEVTQWRNSVQIASVGSGTIEFGGLDATEESCPSGTGCPSGTCAAWYGGRKKKGTCRTPTPCCHLRTSVSSVISAQSGDVFRLVLTAQAGVTETDTSNNTVEATF